MAVHDLTPQLRTRLSRLEKLVGAPAVEELVRGAQEELGRPGTWGTTFTLVQAWATTAG